MLKSMTGYGRCEDTIGDRTFLVEIRSLNGKQFEALLKIPQLLKPYEFDIRGLLSERLLRGSIECTVTMRVNGAAKPVTINTDLAKSYYAQLRSLTDSLGLDTSNILDALLKLPEVIVPTTDAFSADDWASFSRILLRAIDELDAHRTHEGRSLEIDLIERIEHIGRLQEDVMRVEPLRREKIRDHIRKTLEEQVGPDRYDTNRLEQELIYHIEKIDISEEQVRLTNHCAYFRTLIDEPGEGKGKKLSFVLQEIGREINTTGSKAYDAEIQRSVVLMKDELEKAKEQVLNVL
ncbi:MAG: YicC/YloC family endoribonuclease [bacterium]|jgi:uncharacterized protein (TIGR00255 family)|nr:YicC family protein [Chitinophagaceae bacterium]